MTTASPAVERQQFAIEQLALAGERGFDFGDPRRRQCQSLEADGFGALPERGDADFAQAVELAGYGREVVAGERARLGGKVNAAVGDQDFGFALAFRVEQNLPGAG